MKVRLSLALLCLIGASRVWSQDSLQWPNDVRQLLDQAKGLVGVDCDQFPTLKIAEARARAEQAANDFDHAIEQIADRLTDEMAGRLPAFEGKDIDAKLALLAWDRKKRPDTYELIRKTYIVGVQNPRLHVTRAVLPAEEHLTEEYRLAWEYFLLAPPHQNKGRNVVGDIGLALEKIRSPASLSSCVHLFRQSTLSGQRGRALGIISWIISADSLRALFECLRIAEEHKRLHPEIEFEPSLAADIVYVLTDGEHLGTRAQWRAVIEAFPREGLDEQENHILDEALAAPQ